MTNLITKLKRDGIIVDKGEFSLERHGEFTSQFGKPVKAHTITERVPAGPPEYLIHEVPEGQGGMNLHAESSYAEHHPEIVALSCGVKAEMGGRTTILDGRKLMKEMSPELRDAWERCTIEWRFPHEKDADAVKDGAFSSTILSVFKYSSLEPLAPVPNLTTINKAQLRETMDMSLDLADAHSWTVGDIVVLDNHRWIHGREPWIGERKVYVQTLESTGF